MKSHEYGFLASNYKKAIEIYKGLGKRKEPLTFDLLPHVSNCAQDYFSSFFNPSPQLECTTVLVIPGVKDTIRHQATLLVPFFYFF